MSEIVSTVVINRPVAKVFDYVTTPANWLAWHPSSVRVSGATDHSLEVGEQVQEDFIVAGRAGGIVWTVIEREAPTGWAIEGHVHRAGGGIIRYSLIAEGQATRFVRNFTYTMDNAFLSILDVLFVRRRIRSESGEALTALKAALDGD